MTKKIFYLATLFKLITFVHADFTYFLTDPSNLVSKKFNIHESIKDRTTFWFNIYTLYDSDTAVIHDTNNLSIVYSTINTADIDDKTLNYSVRYNIIRKYRSKFLNYYKSSLKKLSKGRCNSMYCDQILTALKGARITIPQNKKKRRKLFLKLEKGIRTQTGQKDKIESGIKNIEKYMKNLDLIFKSHSLPTELLAIPLLESSFNLRARSKVSAKGPWQFMKHVGKSFMKINRRVDHRNNPFLSTSAALHLLKQNKKILKYWDLAINAYNSGTGNIRKGLKKMRSLGYKNPRAHHLINNYKSRSYKFASRNFYPEFLALAYILPYRKKIYKLKNNDKKLVKTYITKCKFKAKRLLSRLKSSQYNINEINNHLLSKSYTYPKGTVVYSDVNLNKRKYHLVKNNNYKKYYPKNLYKLARNQNCSTK